LVFLLSDADFWVHAGLTAPNNTHHTNPREKNFLKTINFGCKDTRILTERHQNLNNRAFPAYFPENTLKTPHGFSPILSSKRQYC